MKHGICNSSHLNKGVDRWRFHDYNNNFSSMISIAPRKGGLIGWGGSIVSSGTAAAAWLYDTSCYTVSAAGLPTRPISLASRQRRRQLYRFRLLTLFSPFLIAASSAPLWSGWFHPGGGDIKPGPGLAPQAAQEGWGPDHSSSHFLAWPRSPWPCSAVSAHRETIIPFWPFSWPAAQRPQRAWPGGCSRGAGTAA